MSNNKGTSKGGGPRNGAQEDSDATNKPLAATFMQEFQNLKDKFKNEDDGVDRGIRCKMPSIYWPSRLTFFYV